MMRRGITSKCFVGHFHPSMMEATYCNGLYARVQSGEIAAYSIQHSFPVSKTKSWKADFVITTADGVILEVHECKGMNPSDDNFRLKIALFFERYGDRYPVFVNNRRVYPSASGKRILGLPPKRRRRWPKRLFGGRR